MADPQLPVNTVKVKYRGQTVDVEEFPAEYKLPKSQDVGARYGLTYRNMEFEPEAVDYHDLDALNRHLSGLVVRLHQVRNDLKRARRVVTALKSNLSKSRNRIAVQLEGGDAKSREAVVEIMTEELEGELIVANTLVDELYEMSRALRTELDTVKELSNNVRRLSDLK